MDAQLTVQGCMDAPLTVHEHMDEKVSQGTSLCDWRVQNSTVVGIIENQKGEKLESHRGAHVCVILGNSLLMKATAYEGN